MAIAADPSSSQGKGDDGQATDDIQTLIFFSETRPVLIRLHVRVDNLPLQAAWDEFTRSVFQSLDTNKDGALSRKEAEKTPPAHLLFGMRPYFQWHDLTCQRRTAR